jgi:hypothetical protein
MVATRTARPRGRQGSAIELSWQRHGMQNRLSWRRIRYAHARMDTRVLVNRHTDGGR